MTSRPPTPTGRDNRWAVRRRIVPRPSAPTLIAGRYRLGEVLGRGSGAAVYAATDVRLNRSVTMKVFEPRVARDLWLRARFQRQTAKAAGLDHAHIAAILDAGIAEDFGDGERPFVVTEPAGPGSLRTLLDRTRRLPPGRAVKLARQVAWALGYAHRRGVIHADVKPENILIDEQGERVQLVDFSLSFISTSTGVMSRETIARRAAYVAPEQVNGEPVSPATDVYGLGVLLYEMVVGRPPFVGETPEATAERRVVEHARPVGDFDPSIPPALEAVIGRALERAPRNRWGSAEEFDAELTRLREADLAPVDVRSLPEATASAAAPPRPAGRGTLRWVALCAPIVAGIVALGLGLAFFRPLVESLPRLGSFFERTTIPGVVGMTVPEAEALAHSEGLELTVAAERVTDRVPAGVIVQQSPIAGAQPPYIRPLRVTVSSGLTVPDLRGKTLEEANAALEEVGWRIGKADRGPHPGSPSGTVVAQHPPPGAIVAEPGEMALAVAE
jgi:eukaryotic-like serine/threonine-protein kinase